MWKYIAGMEMRQWRSVEGVQQCYLQYRFAYARALQYILPGMPQVQPYYA
jgi:hypothetical protein